MPPATPRPLTLEETAAVRDPNRLATLELSGLLDSPAEPAFDRFVRMAAELLDAPLAVIDLLDDRRQFCKSLYARTPWSGAREMRLRDSFARWAVISRAPLVVGDAREDERTRGSALIDEGLVGYLGIPLVTGDGSALGTLSVADFRPRAWSATQIELLSDLAAAVVTEIELRLHARERARLERMKGELISVVAHELRTPLTAIRGSLGLLASGRMDPAGEQGRRMISVAAESSERLVRLINEMLDLERLEAGAVELHLEPVAADEVMRRAVDCVQDTPEGQRVRLTTRSNPGLVLQVDADRIVQVLVNIGANAARYSEEGGTVEFSAEQRGPEALVCVKDRGRGIPPDKLDAIFERFAQVNSSDARDRGGVGLGLAICRSIVRQHGGRIWVASELGRGSTFFFTVPSCE